MCITLEQVRDARDMEQILKHIVELAPAKSETKTLTATGEILPIDSKSRKEVPLYTGVIKYFPRALTYVAKVSLAGNKQHVLGQVLRWDRSKSTDELDALTRHLFEAGTYDSDGILHSGKLAWRALANLEKELEALDGSNSK